MRRASSSGTIAVVPARYASSRLPGKPLLRDTGKALIQHVYERVAKAFPRVIVATDDERIRKTVQAFGGEVVMTSAGHPNGTSRIAEVVAKIRCARVVNVQGDEPEVDPAQLRKVAALLDDAEMSTLAVPLEDPRDAGKPERVKVVCDRRGYAIYFSRAPVPYGGPFLLHLGIYGYTRNFLLKFASLPPTALEKSERLEQLRALEHGCRIRVGIVSGAPHGGIDTPEDYRAFVARHKAVLETRG